MAHRISFRLTQNANHGRIIRMMRDESFSPEDIAREVARFIHSAKNEIKRQKAAKTMRINRRLALRRHVQESIDRAWGYVIDAERSGDVDDYVSSMNYFEYECNRLIDLI